jgi:hypothetical protein
MMVKTKERANFYQSREFAGQKESLKNKGL